MRIAFVGKGGSGKTSLAGLFNIVISQQGENILAFDADINTHLSELIGLEEKIPVQKHISRPQNTAFIKEYLKGSNKNIVAMGAFRKSTPPARGSNFVAPHDPNDYLMRNYATRITDNLHIVVVGTYETDQVGASCYHGSLSVMENILSHLVDTQTIVTADMVAGTDAFSNTLHAQFDLLVLVVEPNKRSVDVCKKYIELAQSASIYDNIAIVANKIFETEDKAYINKMVPPELLIGTVGKVTALSSYDREGIGLLNATIDDQIAYTMNTIFAKAKENQVSPKIRHARIVNIHKEYIRKDFVTERYGDISNQIDTDFDIDEIFEKYG